MIFTYPAGFFSVRSAVPVTLSPEEKEDEEGGGKSALPDEIARHLRDRSEAVSLLEEGGVEAGGK